MEILSMPVTFYHKQDPFSIKVHAVVGVAQQARVTFKCIQGETESSAKILFWLQVK